MVEFMDWGVVRVTAGKHKGKLGYYDDDNSEKTAIVYFGVPFESEYFLIPRRYLVKETASHPGLEYFLRQWPEVAERMGVDR